MGNPPFAAWRGRPRRRVALATFADAAAGAELVVNATNGHGRAAGARAWPGPTTSPARSLLDISNPLDFSQGFPPTLFVKDTDSLGEQIQRAFPEARVVKTLNTLTADADGRPEVARRGSRRSSSPATTPQAKADRDRRCSRASATTTSSTSATSSTARGTEMLLPVWLRLMGALGTGAVQLQDRPLTMTRPPT